MLEVAIEHRLMHAETLAYMLHACRAAEDSRAEKAAWKAHRLKSHLVENSRRSRNAGTAAHSRR